MSDNATEPTTDEHQFPSTDADRDADGVPDAFEKALVLGLGLVAATVARKLITVAWKATTGRTPPGGNDTGATLPVVLMWGAAAGAAVGAARLLAERQAHTIAQRRQA